MSQQEPLDDETLWGEPNKTAQDEGAMTQDEIDQRTAEAQLAMAMFLEAE